MRCIKAILAIGTVAATMMVVMSAPVMAQDFGQEFSERRISSGAANPTTTIRNTGDNANLCPTVQQVSNTGNVANEQGVVEGSDGLFPVDDRFRFPVDNRFGFFPVDNRFGFFPVDNRFGFGGSDLDVTGSEINVVPTTSGSCTQTIEQAAAA